MKTTLRPNVVLDEMRRHREATKQPAHPGVTRLEAGFTPEQWELLSGGVCEEVRGAARPDDRWVSRALIVLALLLLGLYFAGLLIGGTHG